MRQRVPVRMQTDLNPFGFKKLPLFTMLRGAARWRGDQRALRRVRLKRYGPVSGCSPSRRGNTP